MRMNIDKWKAAIDAGETPADACLHKGFVAEEIKVIEAERAIRFVISTSDIDRDRDTIDVNGWELTDFQRNPVVLFGHNYYEPPVARALETTIEGGRLKSLAQFPTADVYAFADTIYRMLKAGYLNATSVGFRPIQWVYNEERRGMDFKRQSLLEYSVVPIPSNPNALIESRSNGTITEEDAKLYLQWAEHVLDEWHGEKGLWLPKSKIEDAFAALNTKVISVPKEIDEDGDEKSPCSCQCHIVEGEVVDQFSVVDWLASELRDYNHHSDDPDPLASVTPDMLGDVLLGCVMESVDDALKREYTALTGRLVD